MGRVCYHSCEGACNRGQLDQAVGINSVERFLGDEALQRGWKFAAPARESGKHVLIVGAGPRGSRRRTTCGGSGHRVTVHEAGPMAGGMMRFRDPEVPPAARGARWRKSRGSWISASTLELNRKVTDILDQMQRGGFDAAFLAVGAHIAKRAYIPAGDSARILDAVAVLRDMEGEVEADARAACRRLRRRQHGDRRGAHRQAPGRRGGGHRLPAHAREDARERQRESRRRCRKAS